MDNMVQTAKSLGFSVTPYVGEFGDQKDATLTPTGFQKMSGGLVLPLSHTAGKVRGVVVAESENDDTAMPPGMHTDALSESDMAKLPPLPVPPANSPETKKKRGRSRATIDVDIPEVPAVPVLVKLIIPTVGMLPAQYAHMYKGNGFLVLGLIATSYIPQVASTVDGNIMGKLSLQDAPSIFYVYTGMQFKDKAGIQNMILIQIPEVEQ